MVMTGVIDDVVERRDQFVGQRTHPLKEKQKDINAISSDVEPVP